MDEASVRRAVVGLRYSRRAAWLFLGGVVAYLMLPVPWVVLAAVPAVGALLSQVQAFRAYGVIRRAGALRLMSVLSMIACMVLTLLAAGPLVVRLASPQYRECMRGANTASARERCEREFGRPPAAPVLEP